ncbi:preprotein translocase subunit YajC [Arthrobacter pityocampae]|uniref:Preprotein translocase subunit YajC n=1 Tax=Arthrobacter pityocampae TaxID=547334 RepID=A0A2S5J0K6_9MICC|nr:preprotein translocase subunit YajC [Arthrobacter pityocampae]
MFSLLLPLALAFLIFTMFRRQRKTQQQVKDMRTQMEPGTEVMTQFGLFGTIVSIDQENNKAVLELAPGTRATVHTQALSKVVEQHPAVASEDAEAPVVDPADRTGDGYDAASVPDDVSSIDGVDRTAGGASAGGSTAAGTPGSPSGVETPEETLERLNREPEREKRDARDPRDPKANPDH